MHRGRAWMWPARNLRTPIALTSHPDSAGAFRDSSRKPGLLTLIVYAIVQAFYLFTIAPTVLWGDDAKFQRQAFQLDLVHDSPCDHPLWVLFAHPFARLPIGDVAFRVNLFTSICAALAVTIVFATLARITKSHWAAALGASALAVSHTFWMHAVRTEVYSFNLLMLAIVLYSLLRPRLSRGWLIVSAVAAGLAVDNHVMMWLTIPALAILAVLRAMEDGIAVSEWLPAFMSFFSVVGIYNAIARPVHGVSLNPAAYVPAPREMVSGLVMFGVYVGLQFPSPAIVLAVSGLRESMRSRPLALCLLLILLCNFAAVMRFRAPDTYVFYLLAYFSCAFWVGLGASRLSRRLDSWGHSYRRWMRVSLAVAVLALPVAVYSALPRVLPRMGITAARLGIREIPGRPALEYFLQPSKRQHVGARNFAESALNIVPRDAIIIADHTLLQPMLYLQAVEKVRPDVQAVEVFSQDQVSYALSQSGQRPVFLARTEPYYDIAGLSRFFGIVPLGVVFRLVPLSASESEGRALTPPAKSDRSSR
jgi:hypothetical protein